MKKILMILMALVMTLSFAACGGDGGGNSDGDTGKSTEKEVKRVTTESGDISVMPLDIPDYITKAEEGYNKILMAKEGDGYGVGEYVLIDGVSQDDETDLGYPSYVKGQEYTIDMMLADFQNKNQYKTYTKTTIGDREYVVYEETDSIYYYTVANNYPVMIQVIGESMKNNDKVMEMIDTIEYNY